MKALPSQRGSSQVVLIVGAVVILAVAFTAYRVLNNSDTETANNSAQSTTAAPNKIDNKADLNQASKALDSTAVDSVNPSQLDGDITSLL